MTAVDVPTIPRTMRALRFAGGDAVELVERDVPRPTEDQALIRIEASAVCGSERKSLAAGSDVNSGHEAAGIVVAAPPGSPVPVGARVGVAAVVGCGTCAACRAGGEVRCTDLRGVQVGLHAEYAAVALSTLRVMPDGTDPADAVLVAGDTLGVPVRGVRRAPAPEGARVLVIGLGPVGLATVAVRSFLGNEVVAIEPSPERRALAERLGAAATVAPGEALPDGPEPAVVVEASGRPESVALALKTVVRGGTVLQSGECLSAEISPSLLLFREIAYVGGWYYASEDWPEMLRLFRAGLDLRRLVTHDVPADRAPDAYAHFLSSASGKVVLRWA